MITEDQLEQQCLGVFRHRYCNTAFDVGAANPHSRVASPNVPSWHLCP